MKWITQTLRWGSTLLIARLLTPADYGLVGYATVYLGLVALINEFGLSAAIVQQRHLREDQIARLGGLSVLLGIFFFAVTAGCSGLVAAFFDDPRVRPVLLVLGSTFIIRGVSVLPRSLLTRDLRFRTLAWVDGIEAMALTATTVALALLGARHWSLVWGSLAGTAAGTVAALLWARHPVAWPARLGEIGESVRFGWHVAVSRVTWYVYSNADFAVVGRMLGPAALGAYSFGWTIANIPVERVSAIVGRVTTGIFASVQDDRAALRRYLLTVTEGLAIITFPAAIGLALVAREFVLVVLGREWEAAIVPLALLVFYSSFRSITLLFAQILIALGEARRNMRFNIIAALVLPALFVAGASLRGTAGVAMAWIVGFPIVFVPFFMRHTFRLIGLRTADYLRALWPAVSATLAMAAAVLAVKLLVSDVALARAVGVTELAARAVGSEAIAATPVLAARLALEVLAGAAGYASAFALVHRGRLRAYRALLGQLRAARA
jgi:PST family polysaccharide transporter